MCNQTIFSAYSREKRKKKKNLNYFFSLEKMSEFKAQELILPASYLIDLSAAMNLEERFAERSDRSAQRLQVQGDK